MGEKAILFDATRCIGCRSCEVACRRWNGVEPGDNPSQSTNDSPRDLSPSTCLVIISPAKLENNATRQSFIRRSCMHCTEAACVEVCPAKALFRNQYGSVSYDKNKCIGCGYCTQFCPFDIPRLDADRLSGVGKMSKCTFCCTPGRDRLSAGQEPACVEACPVQAIIYDDRDKLVVEGKKRVVALNSSQSKEYPRATLYGEKELGGLHVLYVQVDSAELQGLPEDPQFPVLATIRQDILHPLSWIAWAAVAVILGTMVLVNRANRIRQEEEEEE